MGLQIERIHALCFDVDGTLSDTDDMYVKRFARLLPRFLFRDPKHTARRFVMWVEAPGNALLGMTDTIGLDDEMIAVINWLHRHKKERAKHFMLIKGVDKMLARLHGKYPMAVVSARDKRGTMAFLEQFGLTKYFDHVITALSAEHTKPYPDPILLAAEKMGVAPEECLMVGDTTVDMRAGKAAGTQTVGVLCGFGEREELVRKGADLILESTAELADILL
ncbi:MAG: phosphoglycolate phosphatase [Anaerolineales bacterium]